MRVLAIITSNFLLCWSLPAAPQPEGETVNMLDASMQLMHGSQEPFDRDFLTSLFSCMESLSPSLWPTSNGAWEGLVAYHQSNGSGIYEPCNYASNFAYYHVVTSICGNPKWNIDQSYQVAMAQAFTALTVGSSFWHGSHTLLGNIADNRFIDVVAFLAHQASLEHLEVSTSVRDLSFNPRGATSIETAEQLALMLQTAPVNDWKQGIAELDTPDYMLTFSGIICTLLTLQLPDSQVDVALPSLMDLFNLPEEARTFIFDHYLPEIRAATEDISLGLLEKAQFQLDTVGTLIKLIYAFLWQEYVLTDADIFLDPEVNKFGAQFLKTVNQLADLMTSFPLLDPALQTGIGLYPGEEWCNPKEPHSKWHIESANGLMDLMLLADETYRITGAHY